MSDCPKCYYCGKDTMHIRIINNKKEFECLDCFAASLAKAGLTIGEVLK